jgi:hypothetical protein
VAPCVLNCLCVLQNLKDPALVERLLARTPLKRLAQPEDVSGRGWEGRGGAGGQGQLLGTQCA